MRSTKWVTVLATAALTFGVAACGDDNNDSSSSSTGSSGPDSTTAKSGGAKRVARPPPESTVNLYESQDRPLFTANIKAICPDCQLIVNSNVQDDATEQ